MIFAEIKANYSIQDVAELVVGSELSGIGDGTLQFEKGECPICGHMGCFRINDREVPGYWKCFSCDQGGDSIRLVEKVMGVGAKQAADYIVGELGGRASVSPMRPKKQLSEVSDDEDVANYDVEDESERRSELFEAATTFYQTELSANEEAGKYQAQVKGHKRETLERFRVGYSDGGLCKSLLMEGVPEAELIKWSLMNKRGRDFLPESVFIYPRINEEGVVGAFSFKDPKKRLQWQSPSSVSNGRTVFFGQQTLVSFPDEVIIVEGENDLLSLVDIGWGKGVLATTGQISAVQLEFLLGLEKRYQSAGRPGPRLITLFDGDEAGEKYRVKVNSLGLNNLVQATSGQYKDVDEAIQAGRVSTSADLRQMISENTWRALPDFDAAGIEDNETTEMDNARRLLKVLDGRASFVVDQSDWMYWNGSRWCSNGDLAIRHELKDVARYWKSKAIGYERSEDKSKASACRKQHGIVLSKAGMNNIIDMARTEPCVQSRSADFDRNPQLIGLENGVFCLDRMDLLAALPELKVTKQLPFAYGSGAACPSWERFISETAKAEEWTEVGRKLTPEEASRDAKEMSEFLQEIAGIALSGKANFKGFFYVMGKKDTGKSVYTNLLLSLMGEYGKSITPQSLMAGAMQGGDVKAPEIAGLEGVRLALASEAQEGARLNEDLIKRLTGADPITARGNYSNPITFMPQLTLMFSANERPALSGVSAAFWERMLVVPFLNCVPSDQQDRDLPEKLRGELPGIFLWCLEGWRRFKARGKLHIPERVAAYSHNLREVQDVLGEFLGEAVDHKDGCYIACNDLYTAYRVYMQSSGMTALGRSRFVSKLEDMGIVRVRKRLGCDANAKWYYKDVISREPLDVIIGLKP